MCRQDKVTEAYNIAKNDLENNRDNVWNHRSMAWAIYYTLKNDVGRRQLDAILAHLDALRHLELINPTDDALVFNNVLREVTKYCKTVNQNNIETANRIFDAIKCYAFEPSLEHSLLLHEFKKFTSWNRRVEFLEWWNLDKLRPEDFEPFTPQNGRAVMALAESAYIAYSKALLETDDKQKIAEFIPKLKKVAEEHPEMTYPPYYCGKLMIAVSADRNETLKQLIPFVKRKKSEFWVWDLMADVYVKEPEKLLACLLRATHCKTQEAFLKQIRQRLVETYLLRDDYPRAKHNIDILLKTIAENAWKVPYKVQEWVHQSWYTNTVPDSSDPIDFKCITNRMLINGSQESIAIVTFVDHEKYLAYIVYGNKKSARTRLKKIGENVQEGSIRRIFWNHGVDGNSIMIEGAEQATADDIKGLDYIKIIEGTVLRRDGKNFAFISDGSTRCFINPTLVSRHNLSNGTRIKAIATLKFNKKQGTWDWDVVTLKLMA